jgi:hypothetical protein
MIVSVFVRRLKPRHTFDDFLTSLRARHKVRSTGEPRSIAFGSDASLLAALGGS